MASLDKLAIRGVRSFDDKSINIIQFFQPLTVIVGYNGSGKTTIIECLKYATTGDLPPNTKGGAFVHDPQMASSNEVKAQVRLRFYAANKVRMNCVRNLQVSRKKGGGLTMKTLEGLLQIADDDAKSGKRGTLSTKCSELDEEIPRLLGVSRSILENVIFCHQEDSNWPLAEPASLKKKFDDIFEATRYTKALDNIKSLRKDRAVVLKVDKASLEGLKVDKDRADTIKTKLVRLQSDLAEEEATLEDLNQDIRVKTAQNSKLYNEGVKFREILARAESLEDKEKLQRDNMAALEATMTVIEDSDEELQKRKESFRANLAQSRDKQDALRRRITEKGEELHNCQVRHQKKLSEKGGLEAEQRSHEQAKAKRQTSIRNLSADLGIKGFDGPSLSEDRISDFEQSIRDELRKLHSELASAKEANGEMEEKLSTSWQNLRAELRAKQSEREQIAATIKRTKDKIKKAQDELEPTFLTKSDLEAVEKEREEIGNKVATAQKEFEDAQYDELVRKKNSEIREKDDLREERTAQTNLLNRHAEMRASLAMKQQESKSRRANATSLMERHRSALSKYTAGDVTPEHVETELGKSLTRHEQDLAKLEKAEQSKNEEFQQVRTELTFTQKQYSDKQDLVTELHKSVKEILTPEFTDSTAREAVTICADEIAAAKDEYASVDSLDSFLRRVLREAKGKGHCFACNRGVSKTELAAIEKHITSTLASGDTESKKKVCEDDIASWTRRSAELQVALAKETQAKAISEDELPGLRETITRNETKLQAATAELEQSTEQVTKMRAEVKELQMLKRVGADISRQLHEAIDFGKQVEAMQSDLVTTGSTQSAEQMQVEIDQLASTIKTLKRELNGLQQDRETKRSLIASLERDTHRVEMNLVHKRQEYAKKEALEQQLTDMTADYNEKQNESRALDADIEVAAGPIRRAKEELEAFKSEAGEAELKLKNQVSSLEGSLREIRDLNTTVNAFVQQRGAQRLEECLEDIEKVKSQILAVQKDRQELDEKVTVLEREMNQSQSTERNILDNIRFRQLRKEVEEIVREFESLNLGHAQTSHSHFNEKYNQAKEEENRLNGEASHLSGEIASLKSQIKGRESELREEYKGVHQNYKKKLIEVKTSEMANNDLEKYAKALENGIMRYHAIKMEEINDIVRYLWQKTYQGTDIDKILIKSDNEGARGNRSYNYRVCMVKDTVEMDMRGRCSAGQKVLASIIIRLALAESFGSNCGILALDEPTTNLDKDNIEALARSLADLIKERAANSQLQLIVITHDEDFLTLLGQADVLEYYWRVSRDDRSKSIIERARVMS